MPINYNAINLLKYNKSCNYVKMLLSIYFAVNIYYYATYDSFTYVLNYFLYVFYFLWLNKLFKTQRASSG